MSLEMRQNKTVPGGKTSTNTPDNLYAMYICIVAGLLEDDHLWYITLCSLYFYALTLNLRDKMEESYSYISALNDMNTKTLQLDGLRIVRSAAVYS